VIKTLASLKHSLLDIQKTLYRLAHSFPVQRNCAVFVKILVWSAHYSICLFVEILAGFTHSLPGGKKCWPGGQKNSLICYASKKVPRSRTLVNWTLDNGHVLSGRKLVA
jgi:hypothetical protein